MKNLINKMKTKHLSYLTLLLLAFSSINIFPMRMSEMGKSLAKRWTGLQQREEAISKKRELLIFLDDSEKKSGFTISFLLTAIAQKAGPIIVSTSLLNTIINEETRYDFIEAFFQSNQWVVKKINNLLNLLIPISYLKDLNIDIEKVKIFDITMGIDTVSDIELELGLKVNHMETIEYQSMSLPTSLKTKFLSYFYKSPETPELEFANYFINSLDVIFCKKLNYQNKKINIPEWLMYIGGHGNLFHSVAHISLDDFKKLLHFLDSKINTKLLVISSCYAAGINANKIYGEIKLETQEYYSFPIIIQALNDTIAISLRPDIDIKGFFHKKIHLTTHIDFVSFFKKAKKEEGNYNEIIKPIDLNLLENTPQIKLPGIEWFSIIDINKNKVSIGSMLAKTRDPQKPLDIVSFFKKDPQVILLYTDNISFELIVNSSRMKYIISMVSPKVTKENEKTFVVESVYTRIKKISSTQTFSDIVYWFELVVASNCFKCFCIDEIDDKKDIVIFRANDGGMRVYYTDKDDIAFTKKLEKKELAESKEIKFEKLDKDSEYYTYYQDFMRERDEYSKLSASTEDAKQEITSEQIKKIENVLIQQLEEQKEESNVSEPSVD